MEKYKLIEEESNNQIDKIPVVYKNLQYHLDIDSNTDILNETMQINSLRHQTHLFEAVRFYKNIEIFTL